MKQIYVVLGMARSGTSAIARGLKALGIELGQTLTPGDKLWNPTGFWEDTDIVYKINRGVLYALDCQWMSTDLVDEEAQQKPAITDLKNAAKQLLQERMKSTEYWGFKDPRTARIMPFWRDVFQELNLHDQYVIALRNPLSSARSYQTLSGTDVEVGLLMWLMHLIPAVNGTVGKLRVVVSYENMLADPRKQLLRMKERLVLPFEPDPCEIDIYADEFLDKKLHRHVSTHQDLKINPAVAVVPLASEVYELLLKVANDELSFDSAAFQIEWQRVQQEFEKIKPMFRYLDSLLKRNKSLERNMRSIKRSIPWKITYPLRMVDDLLRARRKKAREKRRLIKAYE